MSDAAPRVPGALDLGLDRYLAHIKVERGLLPAFTRVR